MTAEPSASLSDVCPSLPAGSNYVGSRLCYRRADDDAVSLCDAPQQASAPAKTPGLWSIPPVKRQAASRDACQGAKEPRLAMGRGALQTSSWTRVSKSGWHRLRTVWNWAPWPGPGTVRVPTSAMSGTHAIIPRSLALCLCTCQAIARKSSHFSCPSLAGCLGSASSSSSFLP